jgi:hypothetical protein
MELRYEIWELVPVASGCDKEQLTSGFGRKAGGSLKSDWIAPW